MKPEVSERALLAFGIIGITTMLGVMLWTVVDYTRQPRCGGGAVENWIAECAKVRSFVDCEHDVTRVCR